MRKVTMELRLTAIILLTIASKNVLSQTSEAGVTDYEEEIPSTHVPKFLTQATTFTARQGETVVMPCQVDDIGTFSTVWQKGTSQVLFADHIRLSNNAHYVRQDDRSLKIKSIRPDEGGTYTCVVSSNPKAELVHTLSVLVPPKIMLHPKNDIAVQKDQPFHLNCEANGNPKPTITWKKLDGMLPSGKSVHEGHNISAGHAQRSHSGTYECMAANGVGDPKSSSIRVQVLYKPEIEVDNRIVYSGEGVSSELSCTIHSDPPAGVLWRKNDGPHLKNMDNYRMRVSGVRHILEIRKVHNDDFGIYSCEGKNDIGSTKETMEVSGLASPAVFKSNPNGELPESFFLKWSTNSYSRVIDYLLQLREKKEDVEDSENPWTEVHIPAEGQPGLVHSETYEVTGLKQATLYESIMTVHNKHGWSKRSEPFVFSTEGLVQPHPQSMDEDEKEDEINSSTVPASTKMGIFSMLTVVILSFFF